MCERQAHCVAGLGLSADNRRCCQRGGRGAKESSSVHALTGRKPDLAGGGSGGGCGGLGGRIPCRPDANVLPRGALPAFALPGCSFANRTRIPLANRCALGLRAPESPAENAIHGRGSSARTRAETGRRDGRSMGTTMRGPFTRKGRRWSGTVSESAGRDTNRQNRRCQRREESSVRKATMLAICRGAA